MNKWMRKVWRKDILTEFLKPFENGIPPLNCCSRHKNFWSIFYMSLFSKNACGSSLSVTHTRMVEGHESLTLGDTWNLTCRLEYTFLCKCCILIRLVGIYGFKAGILSGLGHKLKPYSVSFNKGLCVLNFLTFTLERQHCTGRLVFLISLNIFPVILNSPSKESPTRITWILCPQGECSVWNNKILISHCVTSI